MTAPTSASRSAATVVTQILLWAWLIGLSVCVGLGYRVMTELADREHLDSGLRQLKVLEARVSELADDTQALRTQPQAATATALRDTRVQIDARIAQLEQAQADHAVLADVQALRTEVEQLKSLRQAAARTSPPSRVAKPTPVKPQQEPFPFRVIGAELRAGQRSVSISPATGELLADQIQVLLPGEAIGRWLLLSIDGDTATFQSGEQTRRLAIP